MSRLSILWIPIVWLYSNYSMTVPASAQDLKVLTRVYEQRPTPAGGVRDEPRSVALTIFHAGRVYDYIDSVGEVIVFEPTENRFTIMSSNRSLMTTVDFDEVRQTLKVAKSEAEKHLDVLASQHGGALPASAAGIVAQFSPGFDETWKPQARELIMANPHLEYRVLCVETDDGTLNETYLHYADWIARLNFALHPQSMYPEARIRLNEALRRRRLLPVEVRLTLQGEQRRQLRAEHKLTWKLDSTDRSLINEWSSRMTKSEMQRVSFQEYQKAMLLSSRSR